MGERVKKKNHNRIEKEDKKNRRKEKKTRKQQWRSKKAQTSVPQAVPRLARSLVGLPV